MTILCATDFSDASDHAIAVAERMTRTFGDDLLLVHVVPPSYAAAVLEQPSVGAFDRGLTERASAVENAIHEAAAQRLRQLADGIRTRGLPVEGTLAEGRPADAILDTARQKGARLIVVGTHGRRPPTRWFIGSVAERTMRGSDRPVLVVRNPPPPSWAEPSRPLRLFVACDFRGASDDAIRFARTVERDAERGAGIELTFVHAYWPPAEAARFGLRSVPADAASPEIEAVLERELRAHPGIGPTARLRVRPSWGRAPDAVARWAEEEGADLLVVGTQAPRGLDLLKEGSFALGVIRHTAVPVIVVRSPERSAAPETVDAGMLPPEGLA